MIALAAILEVSRLLGAISILRLDFFENCVKEFEATRSVEFRFGSDDGVVLSCGERLVTGEEFNRLEATLRPEAENVADLDRTFVNDPVSGLVSVNKSLP